MSEAKYPLVLAHVNIYKGDVLTVCDAEGRAAAAWAYPKYTVSHWDDTWLYYEGGAHGAIGWLYYRIIPEGEKPINSDPSMLKQKKGE